MQVILKLLCGPLNTGPRNTNTPESNTTPALQYPSRCNSSTKQLSPSLSPALSFPHPLAPFLPPPPPASVRASAFTPRGSRPPTYTINFSHAPHGIPIKSAVCLFEGHEYCLHSSPLRSISCCGFYVHRYCSTLLKIFPCLGRILVRLHRHSVHVRSFRSEIILYIFLCGQISDMLKGL